VTPVVAMADDVKAPESRGHPAPSPASESAGGVLELACLTKRFGDFVAVDGVDLTVPAGSFFALLGPSGCGKTTSLRMVAGLERPTSGQVLIDGADVTGHKPHRRPVNTVFQSYALFPHLSIFDNVAFGMRRRRARNVEPAVREMLELVELEGYADRRPAQLSGGQQQRVALARALINRPRLLLLDEPLGALDLKLRRQMQLELKRIQTEVGITFVHVTHDQEEAMTMADTVAVMNAGIVEQLGAPEVLYDRPTSTYVANFLGQSNLIRAGVTGRDGDDLVVRVGEQQVRMSASRCPSGVDDLYLGVRPEKLHVAPRAEQRPGMNRLDGVVTDASFTGVSTQYQVRLGWGQEITVFVQNLHATRLRPGDEVAVSWEPEYAFGLDAAQDARAGREEEEDLAGGAEAGP
jgi:spermidine/putrescine transport system ATP-binding protein